MDTVNEPFSPHPYVIVAARNHPLAHKRRIPMEVILRESFLVRERGSDTRASMAECFGELSTIKVAMELKSTETIKQAVIAGMGLSFLSSHAIALDLRVGNLIVVDVAGFPHMRHWYVVHRRNKRLPPVASAFKEFLLKEGASLIEAITHFGAHKGTRPSGAQHGKTARVPPRIKT